MNRSAAGVVVVLILSAGALCADEVFLSSGGKYVGTIVEESETTVTIKTVAGTFTVNKSEVGAIIRGSAARQSYQRRRLRLGADDVEGHYRLGLWCRANGLRAEAEAEFKCCLGIDPGHARAHHALGHVRYQGRWLTQRQMRARGLEEYKGRWLSREEADRLKQADLKKRLQAEWARRIRRLCQQVKHPVLSIRTKAEKELLEISDPAAFPAIVGLLKDSDLRIRRLALELVSRHRIPEAAPLLAKLALHESDPRLGDRARVSAVALVNDDALKVLINGLWDARSVVRHRACVMLGRIGDRRAVPFLIPSIKEGFLVSDSSKEAQPALESSSGVLPAQESTQLPLGVYRALTESMRQARWIANRQPGKKLVFRTNRDAIDALRSITGQDFGRDVDAWQRWWEKEEKERLRQERQASEGKKAG